MAYELGVPFHWDKPIPQIGSGRPGAGVQEDLRLTVIDERIHYYRRTISGEDYEIQPEGSLDWLPPIPTLLYPPATEEQLQATEEILEFSLPPLLRALYKQVANGGFGPGYGLLGALGGGDEAGWVITDEYLIRKGKKQSIDLLACERRTFKKDNDSHKYLTDREIIVPQGFWPDRLLPISHNGCGLFYYLEAPTDAVFYGGDDHVTLRLLANSFEDFLNRWMLEDLFDGTQLSYEYPNPFAPPGGRK